MRELGLRVEGESVKLIQIVTFFWSEASVSGQTPSTRIHSCSPPIRTPTEVTDVSFGCFA